MSSAPSIATGVGAAVAVAAGLVACAAIGGYLTGRGGVEHARYVVLRSSRGAGGALPFQLRRYQPCVEAVTLVPSGDGMRRMTSRGFRAVAGYIFGGNAARDASRQATPVAMTAPVVSAPVSAAPLLGGGGSGGGGGGGGRSIAMTAPVASASTEAGLEVSFIMPSRFQRAEELPEPLSRGVALRELPARLEAVHAFGGGLPDDAAAQALARRLLAAVRAEGLMPAPAPGGADVDGERVALRMYAYDPPWVLPIFRLNEISITLADTAAAS